MKKIFFDCEFTGLHQNTTLISIGLVADCGKTFYAEFNDYDKNQIDEWIEKNIINKLKFNDRSVVYNSPTVMTNVGLKKDTLGVRTQLNRWLAQFEEMIEMWSDCLAYDWVLFCQLWGHALKVPEDIYYIPFDICTLFKIKGIDPDVNREDFVGNIAWLAGEEEKHNSLWDALIIKACYEKLIGGKNDK